MKHGCGNVTFKSNLYVLITHLNANILYHIIVLKETV